MSLLETTKEDMRYQDAHLIVDAERAAARLDGSLLPLTHKEFELLAMLVRHADELVSRQALLTHIWGYQPGVRSRTLDVHIRRLRKHLGKFANRYIETIFSKGYRFQSYKEPVTDIADSPCAFGSHESPASV